MKYIILLGDGMADEPIESLCGKTPLMAADTPNLDRLARSGHARFGTFVTLPEGFPTSSDVGNMSVLGYNLEEAFQGRGPLEAASLGIVLDEDQIAMRCNLVTASDGKILDYSGGQCSSEEAAPLMETLQNEFASDEVVFHPGVAYRNLLTLKGPKYTADFKFEKPDDHPGDPYADLLPQARGPESEETAALLRRIMLESIPLLSDHAVNRTRASAGKPLANMAWLWSAGTKPNVPPFGQLWNGRSGAIISAVGVINGIGILGDLEVIEVEGATGYIDTNYEGKARAAVEALARHDFVYLHVEAMDEVSHSGEIELKVKALEDWDKRCIGTFLAEYIDLDDLAIAVLPDHPVPVEKRVHTRTPVPVMFVHPDREGDPGDLLYNEVDALKGSVGPLEGDGVMRTLFGD